LIKVGYALSVEVFYVLVFVCMGLFNDVEDFEPPLLQLVWGLCLLLAELAVGRAYTEFALD
jgi:hypothetical protein